ncbi:MULTISPECIES: GNAT family N-acetyltransferase [Pseudovibrio]|uniref:GNAT family N-acetyltransferase n=1 Tax=Stappiaceae TaxID=2821832 RepID=UPI00236516E1|nr:MULTISPECIES: GNAT family N-acetyltransferase [Pseudovibrio]MDD7909452.1 GNAT family N-acetyltransferase [Pseudovibrio exalbescens]MDX5595012.1 GNAT family N-acetyltransferase [Pseudovibrio sp. SPO723]
MSVPIHRKATEADLPVLLTLEERYMAELEPQHYEHWKAAEAAKKKMLADHLPQTHVSVLADQVVGFCSWGLVREEPKILHLYVMQDFRRYGIAAQLLALAEEQVKRAGFNRCSYAPISTHPARTFLEQGGYKLVREDGERLHLLKTW